MYTLGINSFDDKEREFVNELKLCSWMAYPNAPRHSCRHSA